MSLFKKPWFQALCMLLLGAGVAFLMFRTHDLDSLWAEMRKADARFLILAVALSAGGHVLRAMRWKRLYAGAGSKAGLGNAFAALMTGYLVNFAIPRLGEITRCAIMLRQNQIPLLRSFGTVIVERVVDVSMLALLAILTLVTASAALTAAIDARVVLPLRKTFDTYAPEILYFALAGTGMLVLSLFLFRSTWFRLRWKWAGEALQKAREGLFSLWHLRSKAGFLAETMGIWLSYWSGPVCTLAALDMLTPQFLGVSFAMFTMGSIARTIPIPAGSLGPYHFLVSQVLMAFGFSATQSLAAATLNHATQTGFYFLAGICSVVYLALKRPAQEV
jgi:hypothetical protein